MAHVRYFLDRKEIKTNRLFQTGAQCSNNKQNILIGLRPDHVKKISSRPIIKFKKRHTESVPTWVPTW